MAVILQLYTAVVRPAALLLALGCAVLAVAALGGRFSARLDLITHLAPALFLGGALAGIAWWALDRPGALTPALAAVAVAASGALMAPEMIQALWPRTAPPGGETLKLIQFNLWGRNTDPVGTTRWILQQDADILVLEEVDGPSDAIIRALSAAYPHQLSCRQPNPCSNMILSRAPALAGGALTGSDPATQLDTVWGRFASKGGVFEVVGVHLTRPFPPGPQQAQADGLAATLASLPRRRLILAGDFNSTPWSFTLKRFDRMSGLLRRTRALASWPAGAFSGYRLHSPIPLVPIDHVYAGSDWRTVSVRRGPRLGSDHFPVVVTLRLEPASVVRGHLG